MEFTITRLNSDIPEAISVLATSKFTDQTQNSTILFTTSPSYVDFSPRLMVSIYIVVDSKVISDKRHRLPRLAKPFTVSNGTVTTVVFRLTGCLLDFIIFVVHACIIQFTLLIQYFVNINKNSLCSILSQITIDQ